MALELSTAGFGMLTCAWLPQVCVHAGQAVPLACRARPRERQPRRHRHGRQLGGHHAGRCAAAAVWPVEQPALPRLLRRGPGRPRALPPAPGLSLKKRWQAWRRSKGLDTARPNLVMSSATHVCWEKFCRYWDVEARYAYAEEGRYSAGPDQLRPLCDDNTIGVAAVLGTT